ncbi:MAG TPA: S8 family serine peptidase [Kutzneria sp.]
MLRGLVLVTVAASAIALTTAGPSAASAAPLPLAGEGTSALGDLVGRPTAPSTPKPDSVIVVTDGTAKFGANAKTIDGVPNASLVHVDGDVDQAAQELRKQPGVRFAEPNRAVSGMSSGQLPVPGYAANLPVAGPDNYGVTSSLQSFLNANGVNALGAYDTLTSRYHQLPGAGQIITNVSSGDLTDQTTVVKDGQRYLDIPSMPLIPTYVNTAGGLSPTGTTTGQDAQLAEVLLDFAVMAPLPHDKQRPEALGSKSTDLLGIAPGAQYRLVVPQEVSTGGIAEALLAAARQTPRPNVITASLGFGVDQYGFPGRYLEDDALLQSVVGTIVRDYHIVVTISSNDGTRLYTPAAVGPDGGSTPTDLARKASETTDISDDNFSTAPSKVLDSGAIAVGGTTLDDTLSQPGGANGTYATTRTNGSMNYSSGFGDRIDVSAPGNGIPAFIHTAGGAPQAVTAVFNGGTSASAPEVAAAAAVVLQAGRLAGKHLEPTDVRKVLQKTGRPAATPPQIDRKLNVGNQIDVTAAVDSLLPRASKTEIQRISVAHRVTFGNLGGNFTEASHPNRIDLQTGGSGEGLVGPVTIGADVTGAPDRKLDYVVTVNGKEFHADQPAVRITPTQLLQAAGLPVVDANDRTVDLTFQVRVGHKVLASAKKTLAIGPTDGAYAEATAPIAPATVKLGAPVTVHYDLTGVRNAKSPQLAVSSIGHWNPFTAPIFSAPYKVPLTAVSGDVTIPASAFNGGGGVYGIGVVQDSTSLRPVYGEFASIRVDGGSIDGLGPDHRVQAPTFNDNLHGLTLNRTAPNFTVNYDVRGIPGATGAELEFSSPAPTLFNSYNTVTNANGTQPDNDGIDGGSALVRKLAGRNGSATFDATRLGLGFSDSYNVRVIALGRNGKPVGQASPSSFLELDDGVTPDNTAVIDFAAQGADSVVVTDDGGGHQAVRRYDPRNGTYGTNLATGNGFRLVGVDPSSHRAAVLHGNAVEVYDIQAAKLVGTAAFGDYLPIGGRVDTTRHRAAILLRHNGDNADAVVSVDLATVTAGQPIAADHGVAAGTYFLIDVDQKTGQVFISKAGGGLICFAGGNGLLARVDLDAATVTPAGQSDGCAGSLAVDEGTNTAYQLSYRSFSVNINGTANLIPVGGDTLVPGNAIAVRQQAPLTLAVDGGHHLALVAFQTPPAVPQFGAVGGLIFDNNATSQLAVVDLATGKAIGAVRGMNYSTGLVGPGPGRGVQLDPATRTGWTFSGDAHQVQQFSY